MSQDRKPSRLAMVETEEVEGEVVIYHPGRERVIHLNPSAALVWHLCTGELSVSQIIENLCALYPESSSQVREDVPGVMQHLTSEGVLDWL